MYRAIIVEDEPWSLANTKTIFPWKNYQFEPPQGVGSAREALDLIAREKTDVLFTDIKMPEMSGLELMKQIRERDADLKIVVISGHADFSFAQEAIAYGVFKYLLKPVKRQDAETLLMELKTVLDQERGSADFTEKYAHIPNQSFKKLLQYVDTHYREKLQMNTLAERFQINASHGSQLFIEYFGCGFSEYITELKMQKALELLDGGMWATEIADFLNYDYVYFNKLFKKRFGVTPRQYHQRGEE